MLESKEKLHPAAEEKDLDPKKSIHFPNGRRPSSSIIRQGLKHCSFSTGTTKSFLHSQPREKEEKLSLSEKNSTEYFHWIILILLTVQSILSCLWL